MLRCWLAAVFVLPQQTVDLSPNSTRVNWSTYPSHAAAGFKPPLQRVSSTVSFGLGFGRPARKAYVRSFAGEARRDHEPDGCFEVVTSWFQEERTKWTVRPFALQATGSDSDCTPAFSSQSAGPPQLVAMLEKLRNAPLDSRAQLRVVDEPKQASGALHDRTSEITASARDEAFTNYDAGVEAEVWAVFDPTPVENPDPGYMFVSVPFGRAHAAWPTGEALMTGLTVDIAITPVNGLVLERRSYVDGIQFALRVYPMESLLALPGQHSVAVRGRGASSSYASSSFEL
ncbi:hypothetical protein WJX73_008727 [Symbiochloris irregularis]|uniref:Uncharacterized protein n=1 Tax=Symbiochloris irregularis TaxID=706552 RepID=A0AAW1PUY4_9CHLO